MRLPIRLLAGLLALDELVVGAWNQFWPESFYTHFPTVDLTPPYSEHYARDFGGATLGIAAVLLVAVIAPRGITALTAGLAFTAFGIPHLVFHAGHLAHASGAEAVFLTVANGIAALLGVLLLVLGVLRMGRDRRLRDPALDGPRGRRDRQHAGGGVRGAVP